jgi:hypothetical protein
MQKINKGDEMKKSFFMLILSLVCFMTFSKNSYAYLDPGTGSYLVQILIASFFGAAFTLKIYWRNVKAWFASLGKNKKKESVDVK